MYDISWAKKFLRKQKKGTHLLKKIFFFSFGISIKKDQVARFNEIKAYMYITSEKKRIINMRSQIFFSS